MKKRTDPSPFAEDPFQTFDSESLRLALQRISRQADGVVENADGDVRFIPAAVLLPIVLRKKGTFVLLTQRTAHLRDHAGEISFPGGRAEPEDFSATHTALREAREEIGISSDQVEILGCLPEYRTGTGFCVTPVVAVVRPPLRLFPDPFEVAEIFEVPLAFLMNPENHRRHSVDYQGRKKIYHSVSYQKHFIWGLTAEIIVTLSRAMSGRL